MPERAAEMRSRFLPVTVRQFPVGNYTTIKCVLYIGNFSAYNTDMSQGERPDQSSQLTTHTQEKEGSSFQTLCGQTDTSKEDLSRGP